jgi:uncharacterized protein (TIGR02453 family)
VATPFTRKTLAFLRALKRNNDREWFRARKTEYEQHVRGPMVVLLDQLANDFRAFAPDLVSEPRVSLFRIYRDTRFSSNKQPLKTNVAAHFPSRRFRKGEGAGLYVEVAPQWVWIGGGIYRPEPAELYAIRARIATDHRRLHRVVTSPAFKKTFGGMSGDQLTRVPRGYPKDHPAADYLRHKQFLGFREYPAEFALSPRFYPELVKVFTALTPLVNYLNDAILESR